MSKYDLKPCPFCGGNAGISSADGEYMPHCYTTNCIMEVAPSFPTAQEAAAAWNRRAATSSKWVDMDKTVIDEKLKDELMKAKDSEGAFGSANPEWTSLLLKFLSTEPPCDRRITVHAKNKGKSVDVTYDPHDTNSVQAIEAWSKALFEEPSKSAQRGSGFLPNGFLPQYSYMEKGDTAEQ